MLKLKGDILILTHHNADIDAVSSAISLHLGLKQNKIKSDIGVAESISRGAKKISSKYKIIINPDCSKYKTVIIVDTSSPEQLAGVKNLKADIIIDHHQKGKLKAEQEIIRKEKSAAQIVYSILKEMDIKITKEIATLIIAGIVADTAHLRLAEKEEFKIITELLEHVKYSEILKLLQIQADPSETIACLKAANKAESYKIGDLIVTMSEVGSHEAGIARCFVRMGADIGIGINSRKGVRISSRAKNTIKKHKINLADIFSGLGDIIDGNGGGHDMAGSANGKDKKAIPKAKKYILDEISKKAGKIKEI